MKTLFNLAVIVACVVLSSFAAYAKTTVVWWDYLGGGDGVRIKSLIKQFNKENADIQIKETTLGWGTPYYDKVQAAAASGQGPDVMLYHESRLPIGILSGALRPFSDDELKSAGVAPADYSPSTWQGMQSDGKQYAIPFDVDSIVLYYNKTLLKKAGLLDANGLPQGLDGAGNFDAALKKLSAGGHVSLSFPSADGSTAWRIFYTLLAQQGGEFITNGKVLDGDNAMKATQALAEMAQWVSAEGATKMRSYPASIGDFTSGKAAFHINGVWEVPTMADLAKKKKLGFEWGAIQMPTIFAQPGTWGDADGFAIPDRKGHEIAPDKLAAVFSVIKWMNEHSVTWATAGHVPAYIPATAEEAFKSLEPNATYASLLETVKFDPSSKITGVASPAYDAASASFVPAINGKMAPADAVAAVKTKLQSLLP